jgi:hypothetical protein
MRIRLWIKRVAIVWGIELLLSIAYMAWLSTGLHHRWANCEDRPEPTYEQKLQAAHEDLAFRAKHAGLSADQFVMRPGTPYDSEFFFQVKGDRERPRQIIVNVYRCLDTEPRFRNVHPRY